jgi:Tfp pilus assembly protein PilZ
MLNQPHSSFSRIPYTQRCRLWRGDEVQDGVLCNISTLGVYLTLDDVPEVGEEVRLSFPLPGADAPIEAVSIVTWQNLEEPVTTESLPRGCGLRFELVNPIDRARIRSVIDEHKDRLPFGIGAITPQSGYTRVPYVQHCALTEAGQTRSAVVCNISTLGVYVTVDPIPEPGATVQIAFLLPGDSRTFTCRATVTWQNLEQAQSMDSLAPGCGLRFDDLAHGDRLRVERVVRAYCAGHAPTD